MQVVTAREQSRALPTDRGRCTPPGPTRLDIAAAVRHERRVAGRTRSLDETAELLAAVFGTRLLPDDLLARLRASRRARRSVA